MMNFSGIRWTGFLIFAWGGLQVFLIKQSNEQRVQDLKGFKEYERAKEASSWERTRDFSTTMKFQMEARNKYPIKSLDEIAQEKDPQIYYLLIAAGFIVLSGGYYGDKELQDKNKASPSKSPISKAEANKLWVQRPRHQGKENSNLPNLVNCKSCNKQLSKNATSCPHCGEPDFIRSDDHSQKHQHSQIIESKPDGHKEETQDPLRIKYYYHNVSSGQVLGPYRKEEIEQLRFENKIDDTTPICQEGSEEWIMYDSWSIGN
jgi:predicted RNA-binding Zn-ribbon protein involved in translation (DUF1610 family)